MTSFASLCANCTCNFRLLVIIRYQSIELHALVEKFVRPRVYSIGIGIINFAPRFVPKAR